MLDNKELKTIVEEAKVSELSDTKQELDIFNTSFEQDLAILSNTSNGNSPLIMGFFFSSSVRSKGSTDSYFLESSYIAIEDQAANVSERCSLKDLLESESSEFEELEVFIEDNHKALANIRNRQQKTLCFFKDDYLLCENKGKNNVFCLRVNEECEMKIIMSVTNNTEEIPRSIRIQENDMVIVITAVISEEEILEHIKRVVNGKDPKVIPIRGYSKEIAGHFESNVIVIAARVLRRI